MQLEILIKWDSFINKNKAASKMRSTKKSYGYCGTIRENSTLWSSLLGSK